MSLPDPRRYGLDDVDAPALTAENPTHAQLVSALRERAAARRDDEIAHVLRSARNQAEYARTWRALCDAVEKSDPQETVFTRVFAIPWIIVCAGTAAATIDCILRDHTQLASALETAGVFGASRSLGVSSALSGLGTLEALKPSEVFLGWQSAQLRDAPPDPIRVLRGVEEVHLRFLLGAAIARVDAPDIVATAANVGLWGTPALRAMTAQLATPGVQLLPMPRAPAGVYSAALNGRRAVLETAFNLFVSNTVRRFRAVVGDPNAALSSHACGEVRVTLSSPLQDEMTEGFRWPLHPADDLMDIERTITEMLGACRLTEPDVYETVLDDYSPTGAVLFPKARAA
jgi:hypothetical protein